MEQDFKIQPIPLSEICFLIPIEIGFAGGLEIIGCVFLLRQRAHQPVQLRVVVPVRPLPQRRLPVRRRVVRRRVPLRQDNLYGRHTLQQLYQKNSNQIRSTPSRTSAGRILLG